MSIVLKLQKKCLDKNEDLQSLLREALLISTKLKLTDFKDWVNNELKGYEDYNKVPEYRTIYSRLMFFNPYQGWIDSRFNNHELADIINKNNITQPIGELEHTLNSVENEFTLTIPPFHEEKIREIFKTDYKAGKFIAKTQIHGIIEQVRNLLLDWTLKLEDQNILGNDDLIFTEREKEIAQGNIFNIKNFTGNVSTGDYSQNSYNENNISNEINNLINELKKLNFSDKKQIVEDLETSKNDSGKIKSILGNLLSKGSEVSSISSMIIDILSLVK